MQVSRWSATQLFFVMLNITVYVSPLRRQPYKLHFYGDCQQHFPPRHFVILELVFSSAWKWSLNSFHVLFSSQSRGRVKEALVGCSAAGVTHGIFHGVRDCGFRELKVLCGALPEYLQCMLINARVSYFLVFNTYLKGTLPCPESLAASAAIFVSIQGRSWNRVMEHCFPILPSHFPLNTKLKP